MSDPGELSDGYHTFDELYAHRNALFLALAKWLQTGWRSKFHHDESMFAGWFIAGCALPGDEQITYHLPHGYWEHTHWMQTLERAPVWDGHTPSDVVYRLMSYVG